MTSEEKRAVARADRADRRFDFSMKAGGFIILAAAGCLVWQAYRWLRSAIWPNFPFRDVLDFFGFPNFRSSWAGVQAIADWVAQSPAAVVLLVIGMLVLWSAFWGQDDHTSPALSQARSKQRQILLDERNKNGGNTKDGV